MSETTNLKLKKHDSPSTNEEQFDIENYLNGNWDKIDENVGEVNTNISNINSKNKEQDTNIEQLQENTETSNNKIEKLETELKEMQEDFYQNSIRGQASGEYIHVEDSSNCRAKIKISGNSEQETREGKENICRITGIFNTNANCIKATYNADGSMTFEKIADINAVHFGFVLNNTTTQNISLFMKYKVQTSNEVCTLYLRMDNGNFSNGVDLDITGKCSEITWTGNLAGKNATAVSFTSTQLNVGDKITVYSIYAVLGDTFEPIVPSPGYQSEIKAVGSNVNILKNTAKTQTINGVTFTVNKDGTVIANGTATAVSFIVINTFSYIANQDYMLSGCPKRWK